MTKICLKLLIGTRITTHTNHKKTSSKLKNVILYQSQEGFST